MPDYQVKNVEPVAVGTDIQVRVFTLADGDVIPWHYHSESTDHYFVLRGKLTGFRVIARKDGAKVRLYSRPGAREDPGTLIGPGSLAGWVGFQGAGGYTTRR